MPLELTIRTAPLPVAPAAAFVIYAPESGAPAGAAGDLWTATGLDWAAIRDAAGFKGKQGNVLDILMPAGLEARRLLVLGSGKPGAANGATAWADRGGSLAGKLLGLRITEAAVVLDGDDVTPEHVAELVAGLQLRAYRFDRYKSPKTGDDNVEPQRLAVTLHVADPAAADSAIADRTATVEGTLLARDLVNEPANELGTVEFADRAARLSELGMEVEVLEEAQLRELGMRSLLAVSQGSVRPPRLVVMRWRGGGKDDPTLAFVGKGVVFDTGGISIKPAASMEDMKGDMGGAAAVTGLMHTLARRKAKVNVVGVIGLVENMPSATATRPGDILRAMSGTTIEVVNTDAEGRLVLADALWYTQQRFKPAFMIDLATLTGAILVTLGHEHAGLFSNDDGLAEKLLAAGRASGEKLWRLPMAPAYEKMIESRFADIKNSAGRHAGSITAAHFLQRFVNDVPWAHLDIAGAAMGVSSSETNTSWAPGFGVALLDRMLRDNYEQ
ncbi:MAG TPA: leucyl aminopeptidase [Devosiaceae bacterium]|jgi:leucyl aminopeptidase|nr:leucyl aminopeptidase [Devosiaceae bacterium]